MKIKGILSSSLYDEPIIIIGERLVTSQYFKHFHAYEVQIGQEEEIFSIDTIADFHVLSLYQSCNSVNRYYVIPKYYVLSDYDL